MDWDIQLLNVNGFLNVCNTSHTGFMVIDSYNETLASECFSARKGEAYLLSLSKDITELYTKGLRQYFRTPQYSGPYRMKDSLKKHQNSRQKLIEVNDIFVYNYREIRGMPQKKTVAPLIHYWVHGWM